MGLLDATENAESFTDSVESLPRFGMSAHPAQPCAMILRDAEDGGPAPGKWASNLFLGSIYRTGLCSRPKVSYPFKQLSSRLVFPSRNNTGGKII